MLNLVIKIIELKQFIINQAEHWFDSYPSDPLVSKRIGFLSIVQELYDDAIDQAKQALGLPLE